MFGLFFLQSTGDSDYEAVSASPCGNDIPGIWNHKLWGNAFVYKNEWRMLVLFIQICIRFKIGIGSNF